MAGQEIISAFLMEQQNRVKSNENEQLISEFTHLDITQSKTFVTTQHLKEPKVQFSFM